MARADGGGCPALGGDEGRDKLRKAGEAQIALDPGYPNGATWQAEGLSSRKGSKERGTETSKYPWEEKINNDSGK